MPDGKPLGRSHALALALLAALGSYAIAATPMSVEIDRLDDASKACGVSEAELERVARRTLERSPMGGTDRQGRISVGVSASGKPRRDCSGRVSVRMSAQRQSAATAGAADSRTRTPVLVYCRKGDATSAPRADFPQKVEASVEYRIRQCLVSLDH